MATDDEIGQSDAAREIAAALIQLAELMSPVLEAAVGYRNAALAHGFDEASAGQMSAQYHQLLMRMVSSQVKVA